MGNHYHLVIETPDGNLSKGMRQLNGIYTQMFNRRHGRVGHLFQGRYKAIVVERDAYLLTVCRYVVLNPVRAGMVGTAAEYPWSSYRATAGLSPGPPWLQTDWLLGQFAAERLQAQRFYGRFVQDGQQHPSPWDDLKGQLFLAGTPFIRTMTSHLEGTRGVGAVARSQRFADRPDLHEVFQGQEALSKSDRDRLIYEMYSRHGYAMVAIAAALGLHDSTVSKIIKVQKDSRFRT